MKDEFDKIKVEAAAYNLSNLDYIVSIDDSDVVLTASIVPYQKADFVVRDMDILGFSEKSSCDTLYVSRVGELANANIRISGVDDVKLAVDSGILPDDLSELCKRFIEVVNSSSLEKERYPLPEFNNS